MGGKDGDGSEGDEDAQDMSRSPAGAGGVDPSTLRPLAYPCCLVVYRHCRTCSIPTVSVPRSTARPLVLSRPPNRVSSAGRRGRRRRFKPRSIFTGGGGSTLRPFDLCNTVTMIELQYAAAICRCCKPRSPMLGALLGALLAALAVATARATRTAKTCQAQIDLYWGRGFDPSTLRPFASRGRPRAALPL